MIERISAGIEAHGFSRRGVIESPLKGDRGGNTEFLAHFEHAAGAPPLRALLGEEARAGGGAAGPGPLGDLRSGRPPAAPESEQD